MDRDRVLQLQRQGLRDWVSMLGVSAPGSRVLEHDGVTAAAIPACAQRSIANSVTYADARSLLRSLEQLAAEYDELGIEAWTVWVPDFESETIAELEAAGHRFDGKPAAMALDLSGWEPREVGDLDWDTEVSAGVLGAINDRAYGLPPESGIGRALSTPPEAYRLYQARVDGEPACVLGTIDHGVDDAGGADLGFYFVATDPRFQGRGLTSRLMTVALADARERGFATSSLQASAAGEPVYRKLGFETHFRLHMYERRRPGSEPSGH